MKILFDECVTKKLRNFLPEHTVLTVTQMKWNGLRNGDLMERAVDENIDLLLTIDKNILSQQNISKFNLILVVFDSKSSKIEVLMNFVPEFKKQLNNFEKRKGYIISI